MMRVLSSFRENVISQDQHKLDYDWIFKAGDARINPNIDLYKEYPGDHRDIVPPDPIPNSVVKSVIADDSVGFPHVKVGHYQVLIESPDTT